MKNLKVFLSMLSLIFVSCSDDKTDDSAIVIDETLFSRSENPVYTSPFDLAADPSILEVDDIIYMYYTAADGIGVAISTDNGNSWSRPNNSQWDYIALEPQPNKWDSTLETAEVIKVGNEYKMYYTGYRENESDNTHVANYEIGLATSQDGINFTRIPQSEEQPIIARNVLNENTYDRHAMTSPGVVYDNGDYHMIYAGWNVTDDWTGMNAGIRILGATSTNGEDWVKIEAPIIIPSEITYSPDVNEASLMKSDDGIWYIPFSTDRSIGIARSNSFTGSYDIYPEAIVSPEFDWDNEVTAPDGMIQNGKMRLWFHGVKEPEYWPWVIGYTEADFPLDWN